MSDVRTVAFGLIEEICRDIGPRLAGTKAEKDAQLVFEREFKADGLQTRWHDFRYNQNLYANLVLHFAVALAGTAVGPTVPLLGAALHVLVVVSYYLDTTKRAMVLRRLFPFVASQNLLAIHTARQPLRRRLVVMGHADSAYTGWLFHEKMLKNATQSPGPLKKSMALILFTLALLSVLEVVHFFVPVPYLWAIGALLTLPTFIGLILNLQIVIKNQVVPGASDNLSGCAALVVLHRRWKSAIPDDCEVVYVVTGAEEVSTGGAWMLARDIRAEWSTQDTTILAIDTLSGGTLRMLVNGEIFTGSIPPELLEAAQAAAAEHPEFGTVERYDIPSGATDAAPFERYGFKALSIGCVDPEIGAPKNYHVPADNPQNFDVEQYERSIGFIDALGRRLMDA
ncbi:MAG: M28 family peptidase [bacterium]